MNKFVIIIMTLFTIISCNKKKDISLDSNFHLVNTNNIVSNNYIIKDLLVKVNKTEDFYDYTETKEKKILKINIPDSWNIENSIINNEKNFKIGEIFSGYLLVNDSNLNQSEKKIKKAYDLFESVIINTKIYKVGKYDLLKVVTKTGASGGDGKPIIWYPCDYYIIVNDSYLFSITFYEMSDKLENSALFDKIIENMVFFDQIK
jgi:hypothetical protein